MTREYSQASIRVRRAQVPVWVWAAQQVGVLRVWVLGGLTLVVPVFGEIAILAIAFGNSYLEGSTGQSLGKKAVGIYVIKCDTGEFLGGWVGIGWVGIGRQLLHILDYLSLCIRFIIGLFNTRTFADMIVGSTVVARPRAPQLPPPPPLYPVPPAQSVFPQPQIPARRPPEPESQPFRRVGAGPLGQVS